ncbi:MAG TPA: hypothetical protein ENG06_00015 [Thermoplasmatales archaeon]|nr:MAG: hypothetical protein FE046_03805 [Thermoplasmata archaeon]RLF31181.1 MAG: hypothetical protein DRN07_07685 [Thermoplasmata archaeon]HDN50142.1 hypothetical protein [Thermoplasmatales archaeon]
MRGLIVLWIVVNIIAIISALFSVHLSPDTLFKFPYLHLLSIGSLFFLINLPFYAAYDRLRED